MTNRLQSVWFNPLQQSRMIVVLYKHPDQSIDWPETLGPFDSEKQADAWISEKQTEGWQGQFCICRMNNPSL